MATGNIADRHARLHRLGDNGELLILPLAERLRRATDWVRLVEAFLRHVNEDHVVPELQLLERLHRLMVAGEAMDGERRLAGRSGMGDGLCGWIAGHTPIFISPPSAFIREIAVQ
jgi:hypothetical protein